MKILLFITIFAATAWAGDPWPTRIPDNLSLCYVNKTISDRYRRMPASLENLVAIIRKVEAHPDTTHWSMGRLASTLVHRFRYDGIIDIVDAGPDVVPVTNERAESDKYRLQWRLVSGTGADFPESSLTQEEKCSLHWMLSYTVNHTARAGEVTRSSLARSVSVGRDEDESGSDEEPAQNPDDADDMNEGKIERLEDVEENDDAVEVYGGENHEEPNKEDSEDNHEDNHEQHNEEIQDENNDEIQEENNEENNEENHETNHEENQEEGNQEENQEELTEDNQEATPEENIEEVDETDSEVSVDEDEDGGNFWKRKRRQAELTASQPLEGGVIHTKYGTIAAGLVLAGIAAGSEPQSALLKDLIKDPTMELSPSSMERVVESIWVATLAGDVAQTSLLRTPKRMESFGPRGQWNSTFCPREYKLVEKEHSMLTNAEFYGGLDGFLMARRMVDWNVGGYMKLSSVLEMYYSENGIHGDSKFRACNRINNYRDSSLVDPSQLKEQSLNAALVMYSRGIDGAPSILPGAKPADVIGQYVNTTITKIGQFINSASVDLDFTQCKGAFSDITAQPKPATYTDLTFVFDQSTDAASIQSQKEMAAALALELDVQVGGSRMETVSGKDGNPYFDLTFTLNGAELACKAANLPLAYTERRVADTLERTRSRILSERSSEKANKVGGANTRAVLIFASTSITSEKEKIKSVLLKMLNEMPDVHIMFATLSNPEELRPFVSNFDRDIIRMTQYTKYADATPDIAQRLATVGARLSYPECRDISSKSNETEAKYIYQGFLNTGTVQYFRLGTEQFFSSNDLYLRFKTMYGVATFCISFNKERPGIGETCKTVSKAGDTVEFKLTQPCGKMVASQCSNIYVSASPITIDDDVPCSEKDCHTPDQVKFIFSHSGMRCNSAVAGAVLSHLTLVLAALMTWLLSR